jgi:hypothetical protein
MAYEALVLSILLYGCECWNLTMKLRNQLRSFHRSCVRQMCNSRIIDRRKTKDLLSKIGLRPMDSYLRLRRLQWLGRMVRMDQKRLPRQLLFSWVNHKRPVGRPQKTYGHAIRDDLMAAAEAAPSDIYSDLQSESWIGLAADKVKWNRFCKSAANAA